MGLKTKESDSATSAALPKPGAPDAKPPRVNEEVEKRLNPYIDANKEDFDRYLKLAQDNPERAARTMMLKDLDRLEREVSLKKNQIAGAKEWLGKQSTETKQFVEQRLAETTHPQQRELALLQLVLNRMRFENSQALSKSAKAMGPKAGASAAA